MTIKPLILGALLMTTCILAAEETGPIVLRTMGSLFFGGSVETLENGETFHGDHGYAQFYIPQNARDYPLVMLHGIGQSGRTYESTPDGREGYQAILPRRDWPVYIVDQPRRGRAGRTLQTNESRIRIPTETRESGVWNAFRNGLWVPPGEPSLYADSQFPSDPASVEQFFRQQTPDTGESPRTPEYRAWMGKTMAQLLELTGQAILVTHSAGGQYGWATAMAAPRGQVKAIIAYEAGHYAFPEGERPAEIPSEIDLVNTVMQPQMVPMEDFLKLTAFPIVIYFGDHVAEEPSNVFNAEVWRIARARAYQFAEAVNRHGGDAQVVELPKLGIHGNTHAAFADKNNLQIADLMEAFLKEKGLDTRDHPHLGPRQPQRNHYTIPLNPTEA